jgi:DNA-binding XRE family transcriptional regulator
MDFCDQVKYIRTKMLLTQDQLAKQVGVSKVTIARWECQKIAPRAVQYGKFLRFCEQNNIVLWDKKQ